MGTVKGLAAAGLIVAAFTAPASAADMMMPPLRGYQAIQPGVVEVGTGWYLRGDVGYTDYRKTADDSFGAPRALFDSIELDKTWAAGGGFGYKFLTWLRADVTADYRFESDFVANSAIPLRRDWAKFDSTTVLANGYLDLGTWYGVTPYVGAGVGAAFNRFKEYQIQAGALPVVELDDQLKTNLAWAFMGGVAVDMGGGFQVDAGYRYVNLGEARSKPDAAGTITRTKELEAHEVRLGFRYMID